MVSVSSLVSAELSPQDRVAEIPNALKTKKKNIRFSFNTTDQMKKRPLLCRKKKTSYLFMTHMFAATPPYMMFLIFLAQSTFQVSWLLSEMRAS